MGGQACVFYGAAEFSRDLDLLILADEANLDRLTVAHAVRFRCRLTTDPGSDASVY